MPELSSNKSGRDISHGTIDVESSDSELDEHRETSPERREGKTPMATTPSRPKPKDCQRAPASRLYHSSNSSSPTTFTTPQSHNNPDEASLSSRVPEVRTPSKSPSKPAGTPGSRRSAIESAFKKKLTIGGASPTQEPRPRPKAVVVGDSDDDEAPTDVESVSAPVRPSYLHGRSFTDSSYSSFNSIISPISATSSFSSVASSSQDFETTRPTSTPSRVEDVFDIPHSEHVTTRRIPKAQPQKEPSPFLPIVAEQQINDATVARFAQSPICADVDQCIIAHCDTTQKILDDNMIAWGTQFEFARGVSTGAWSWEDVRANVRRFQGKSADAAYRVQSEMRGQSNLSNEGVDLSLWRELDREQDAIMENQSRGLGLDGEWRGVKNWYGGQIQQLGRLTGEGGNYKIILEPMEKRRSHRFARRYGSRRFLQLRIPEQTLQNENAQVKRYFTRRFVLCGRLFAPFHSKEGSLYLVETNQNHGRSTEKWCGDQYRMSFQAFINWHNPLVEFKNYNQTISKYATRFAIGLSNSVPALEFETKHIIFIDDITAEGWPKGKPNPPADKLMTDGCGFMNHAALHAIVKYLGYDNIPAGVQGRIAGAKGFWILHPEDTSAAPKIWIRNSQSKIKYSSYDRCHRIFDLLAPSRPSPSIALSAQSIVNLFSNGIPSEYLKRLMEEGLEEEVAPLMDWDKPHAMVFLWDAINKCGNVTGSRTQRLSVALNRVLGLKGRDWGRDNGGIDSDATDSQIGEESSTTYTGRNKYSGAPIGLHESAAELVQSGFHPAETQLLFEKIRYIVQTVIKSSVEKYRIPISESLGAYIIPDPVGVLKEGEVFYRFSKPRKDPTTGMLVHALEGPVLLGRYPIMLGSDMKKVIACYHRELDKWPDVLIISTEGSRSLANELAGGDMDGDEIIAIWDLEIVAAFKNTSLVKEPEGFISANFESKSTVESVQGFCYNNPPSRETNEAFLRHLLANLTDSQVGLYSMMHDNAVVTYGYHDPQTIRLAYIFSTLLDASKTGHRLRQDIKQKDLRKYSNSSPEIAASASLVPSRDILGLLEAAAIKKGDELFERYQTKKPAKDNNQDKDLRRPYDDAVNYAIRAQYSVHKFKGFTDEFSIIREHVSAAKRLFDSACAQSASKRDKQSPIKGGKMFKKAKSEDAMLACAKAYAQPIDDIILLAPNLKQIKASYAYCESPNFAFTVAFQELCGIKAMASLGGHAPSLRIFDDAKSMSASFLKALRVLDEDDVYS